MLYPHGETHFSFPHNSWSTIDLVLLSSCLLSEFQIFGHPDLAGSDHRPVILRCTSAGLSTFSSTPPQVSYRKTNWAKFRSLCESFISFPSMDNPEEATTALCSGISRLAALCTPSSPTPSRRKPVPWWNMDCKKALQNRRKALRQVKRNPTPENLLNYRKLRAKAKQTFKQSRVQSWQTFVAQLSPHTPPKQVWAMVRAFEKNSGYHPIPGLLVDGLLITTPNEVADHLATHLAQSSSDEQLNTDFLVLKLNSDPDTLDFTSSSTEPYNLPFTYRELIAAIHSTKAGALGEDNFHLQMLISMPDETLQLILQLFNVLWARGIFPSCWKTAIVIPLLKPGKNPYQSDSYRPISLLSVIGKIFEKLVNTRLVWLLESRNLLTAVQCGFRPGRSTQDQLLA